MSFRWKQLTYPWSWWKWNIYLWLRDTRRRIGHTFGKHYPYNWLSYKMGFCLICGKKVGKAYYEMTEEEIHALVPHWESPQSGSTTPSGETPGVGS